MIFLPTKTLRRNVIKPRPPDKQSERGARKHKVIGDRKLWFSSLTIVHPPEDGQEHIFVPNFWQVRAVLFMFSLSFISFAGWRLRLRRTELAAVSVKTEVEPLCPIVDGSLFFKGWDNFAEIFIRLSPVFPIPAP